jgi:uncharacterized membrane protein YfcA
MLDSLWLYPVLFCTSLIAGWIDSIAGGGGLITIPVLLGVGLPPQMVLGTNKFQASFGSFTAAYYYVRKGVAPLHKARLGIICTLVGSALGTWAVQQIDPSALSIIIPFLLLGIAIYMLFTPSIGETERHPHLSPTLFFVLFGIGLGFYDGFFGPGVGSFWAFAFVGLLGLDLLKATGYTKVMNFTSNVVSFVLFFAGGHVLVTAGLVMAAGQIIGARVGSGMVVARGVRFIKPIFVTIVILTTLKLLYNRFT